MSFEKQEMPCRSSQQSSKTPRKNLQRRRYHRRPIICIRLRWSRHWLPQRPRLRRRRNGRCLFGCHENHRPHPRPSSRTQRGLQAHGHPHLTRRTQPACLRSRHTRLIPSLVLFYRQYSILLVNGKLTIGSPLYT